MRSDSFCILRCAAVRPGGRAASGRWFSCPVDARVRCGRRWALAKGEHPSGSPAAAPERWVECARECVCGTVPLVECSEQKKKLGASSQQPRRKVDISPPGIYITARAFAIPSSMAISRTKKNRKVTHPRGLDEEPVQESRRTGRGQTTTQRER